MDWAWLYLSREGRITRGTYWLNFVVPYVVLMAVAGLGDMALGLDDYTLLLSQPVSFAVTLLTIWPSICVGAKRCHDRNKSAWWILINLVPLVGPIWWLIEFGCLRGTVGPNRFGRDPTAPASRASPA